MSRALSIAFASISLAALLLAAPAFAADGDCVPFWKCGTTPAGLQAPEVTGLNGTARPGAPLLLLRLPPLPALIPTTQTAKYLFFRIFLLGIRIAGM